MLHFESSLYWFSNNLADKIDETNNFNSVDELQKPRPQGKVLLVKIVLLAILADFNFLTNKNMDYDSQTYQIIFESYYIHLIIIHLIISILLLYSLH